MFLQFFKVFKLVIKNWQTSKWIHNYIRIVTLSKEVDKSVKLPNINIFKNPTRKLIEYGINILIYNYTLYFKKTFYSSCILVIFITFQKKHKPV